MRVLWITHVYPREAGDMLGAFLHRLARELVERGVAVTVLAPGADEAPERETRDGVDIVRWPPPGPGKARVAYTGEMHRAAMRHPIAFARFLDGFGDAASRVAKELRPDVVHAHWWFPGGWVASRRALSPRGVPLVLSVHGTDVRLLGAAPPARILARRVVRRAAFVLPVSRYLEERLAAVGVRPGRSSVLPMPADDTVFHAPVSSESRADLVVAARLTKQKRVDLVLKAWSLARRAGAAGRLHVAGAGPERVALERLTADLSCGDTVEFHGALPAASLAALFRSAVGCVLTSLHEGYGLVVVEAALCAAPSIVARSGALAELVEDGVTGWVAEADPDVVAGAMLEATTRPDEARRRGGAARVRAEGLTPAPIANSLLGIYREALGETPSEGRFH